MRRPQTAFGLVAVMSGLLVASSVATPARAAPLRAEPPPAPVLSAAGATCTSWESTVVAPPTVRVLRTEATDAPDGVRDTVQEVDFRAYVATVMAAEWPEHYPPETLKAGAIATKQFAWYYIVNPRGLTQKVGDAEVCYDVVDSTADQYYKPETRGPGLPDGPGPKILQAIDVTWDISLRKYNRNTQRSRFFLTGYRQGDPDATCGEDATGFKLFHNSTRRCGQDGLQYREILRRYLKPNLEIVDPGSHDIIGTRHGDASVMKVVGNELRARVWTPGQSAPEPGSAVGLTLTDDDLVSYRAADMNRDGREDLVWLKRLDSRSGKLRVALSDGSNYRPAEDWWVGDTLVPLSSARLVVGDFFGNQRTDVGILGRGTSDGTARLVVLKRLPDSSASRFADPKPWWEGAQDPGRIHAAWAGDLSGDGRADLIIRQNIAGGGVSIRTAVTSSPLPKTFPRMGALRTRYQDGTLRAGQVRMTVGDGNRDGRDDVLLLSGGSGRAKIDRLQAGLRGGFKRVRLWIAPKGDPVPVRRTSLGVADVDYDGRADLLLYSDRGDGRGTRVRVLRSRYSSLGPGPGWRTGIPWETLRPY